MIAKPDQRNRLMQKLKTETCVRRKERKLRMIESDEMTRLHKTKRSPGPPVEWKTGAPRERTFPASPHRTGRADFPHPALRSPSSGGLRRSLSRWLTFPTIRYSRHRS